MLDEYYESTVVMFATSQHSLGEQFFEETKKNDLLAYGETEDAERLLQILNSHRIRNRIIEKYDLYTHYNIDPSEPGAKTDMALTYGSNVSANLTRFGSIRVQVLDTDPELARDMANDMAFLVDSVANSMRNERANEAYKLALGALAQTSSRCASRRQLGHVARHGHLRFRNASGRVDGPIRHGRGFRAHLRRQHPQRDLERLGTLANGYNNLSAYLEAAYEQQSLLKKRVELMRVDAETQLSSSFIVDYASAADKKAKPVRWLIVVMTSVVAVGAPSWPCSPGTRCNAPRTPPERTMTTRALDGWLASP